MNTNTCQAASGRTGRAGQALCRDAGHGAFLSAPNELKRPTPPGSEPCGLLLQRLYRCEQWLGAGVSLSGEIANTWSLLTRTWGILTSCALREVK